jgi:hypothetical protein
MAQNGTFNSTVTPSGPNGTLVVGGSSGAVTVTYAGTTCTVNQSASSGNALSFSYSDGTHTYNFVGAIANGTYRGTCVQAQAAAHSNRVATDDNWTATATTGVPKPAHA